MKKNNNDNLPQLIVALDGIGEGANYIHILDAKDDVEYFCPCCHGKVLPRAYKRDKDYEVQPHFYHDSGGCSNESYLHFICKNWLMVSGCKFIVEDTEYEVESVDVEKTLKTDAGIYKPDIIVSTTSGKTFYFEIRVTNKKKIDTIRKWDELGNDVVEVDVRYFANQKYKNEIPIFNLIYSDGRCFIQEYIPKNYSDVIGVRKLHWKRQDRINYKIQWERLDWFWQCLRDFDGTNKDNVLSAYKSLDYEDMEWCYFNIQGKSCAILKNDFAKTINECFLDYIMENSYRDSKITANISVEHISPRIYISKLYILYDFNRFKIAEYNENKVGVIKGVLRYEYISKIKKEFTQRIELFKKNILNMEFLIEKIKSFDYIKDVYGITYNGAHESFNDAKVKVIFHTMVNNSYFELQRECMFLRNLSVDYVKKRYKEILLDEECNMRLIKLLMDRDEYVKKWKNFSSDVFHIEIYKNFIKLYKNNLLISFYECKDINCFPISDIDSIFSYAIKYREKYENHLNYFVDAIKNCKNKKWNIYNDKGYSGYADDAFIISFCRNDRYHSFALKIPYDYANKDPESYIRSHFEAKMRHIMNNNWYPNYTML